MTHVVMALWSHLVGCFSSSLLYKELPTTQVHYLDWLVDSLYPRVHRGQDKASL